MPRNTKPKEASPSPELLIGGAQAPPAEKPTGGGRRATSAPRPAAGATSAPQAEASGRGTRSTAGTRGQGANPAPARATTRQTRREPLTPQVPAETATLPTQPESDLGPELRQLRQELTEALPLLQTVPRQANELRICLKEMGQTLVEVVRQLREAEQQAREARAQADHLRQERAAAEHALAALRQQRSEEEGRLAALREEAGEAEVRLDALRRESADAEGILHALRREFQDAHQWLEGRRQQPTPAPIPATTSPAPASAERHNRLGATVDPGVVVARVLPEMPAARAGLVMGDVITAVNGTEIFSGDELRDLVHEASAGEELSLRVERAGAFTDIPVRLEATPVDASALPEGHNRLGVTVERGVVIAEVLPASPAARSGLLHGDVILSANGMAVVSGPQLRDLIHDTKPGADVILTIERGESRFESRVRLEPALEGGAVRGLA